jgi:ribosomal protein S12
MFGYKVHIGVGGYPFIALEGVQYQGFAILAYADKIFFIYIKAGVSKHIFSVTPGKGNSTLRKNCR